jgi:prolipoprotein diacylglyceryltransferase
VQVYEVFFLVLVGIVVSMKKQLPEGARFRIFLGSYLAWRLVIDFLKPQPLIAGMNLIQWSCLAGILFLIFDQTQQRRRVHERAAC